MKHTDDDFKNFIGYKEDNIIRPLCITCAQMSGYIKFLKTEEKNMSFVIKDDSVLVKYNKIWNIKHKISYHAYLWWTIHKI